MTLEDIRQKMVDIFVRKRYPRNHIKANFEEILVEALDGRESDV